MSDWDFLWGLSGQALEDAMFSGATYEEWGLIEQELDRELIGPNGKNVMVFVDGENVPAKWYEQIRSRVEWLVDHHQAKVYARQKDGATQRWHEVSLESGIKEIRLFGGPAKNKVDKKIKIGTKISRFHPGMLAVVMHIVMDDRWVAGGELQAAFGRWVRPGGRWAWLGVI